MTDEQKYIICGRVGYSSVAPGSDTRECSECHHPIWLIISSQKIMQENSSDKFVLICMDCSQPLVSQADPEDICPVNNGQLVELASYLGISTAEASQWQKL